MIVDPDDGLPVMDVGAWSEDKHDLIRRFVGASWAARTKWAQKTYVDLFCGPGRIQVRGNAKVQDGSPLVAWRESIQHGGAFSDVYVADVSPVSTHACSWRLGLLGAPVQAFQGRASDTVDQVMPQLRRSGLHLVVLDPYSMGALDFFILQKLARLDHVDIILHFSLMDLQRNIENEFGKSAGMLEKFAPSWRNHVQLHEKSKEGARKAYLNYWSSLLRSLDFKVAARAPLFTNSNKGPLYRLVLLYRHPLSAKLWDDVARPSKQRDFDF